MVKRFIERSYDRICVLLVYNESEKRNFWGHFISSVKKKKGVMTLRYVSIQISDGLALFVSEEGKEPRAIILDFFLLAEKVFVFVFF